MAARARLFVTVAVAVGLLAGACSSGEPGTSGSVEADATTTSRAETTTTLGLLDPQAIVVPDMPGAEDLAVVDGFGPIALGRVVVLVEDGSAATVVDEIAAAVSGTHTGELGFIGLHQFALADSSVETLTAAIAAAEAVAGVISAGADQASFVLVECVSTSPLADPSMTSGDNASHYQAIGLQEAWDIIAASGIDTGDVHVGVVDEAYMPEASNENDGPVKILTPRSITESPSLDMAGKPALGNLNHGTSVTNVIAADPDNGGMVGVASALGGKVTVTVDDIFDGSPAWVDLPEPDPDNPAHMSHRNGAYVVPTLAKILRQAEEGATVINMSFGPERPSADNAWQAEVYTLFFQRMAEKYPNVVFVAAAGNENGNLDGANYYPGGLRLPNVITVGAVDHTGGQASFTNTNTGGGEVTIAAPGVAVPLGVDPTTDQVFTGSGTSFSSPMVAGAVALIQSVNPDLNAAEIKQLLVDTARAGVAAADGSDTSKLIPATVGGGILRVDDAVLAAINLRRAAQSPPLPALVREDMLAQVSFSVDSSQTAGDGFTVTASVETAPNPATLSFDFFSEGVVSGASSQTVGMGETAEWGVTTARPGEITSGKVCRVEAARCCVITLEPVSLAGSYEGALTIGKVEATGDITIDGPDGPQEVSREECESMHAEVVGQSLTMSIELVDGGSGASGPVIGVLVGVDGETTPLGPSSWSAAGTSVSMELAVDSDGYGGGFVLQGTATPATTGSAISGTWSLVGIENLVFSGDFAFVSAS